VSVTPTSSTTIVRTSGADGKVVFGMIGLGQASIVASSADWVFEPIAPVNIVPDVLTTVFAYGFRPCTITINSVDASGAAIPYANVLLDDLASSRSYAAQTSAAGAVTITGVFPATYSVEASKTGYAAGSATLSGLASGDTTSCTVVLSPLPPANAFRVQVGDGTSAVASASVLLKLGTTTIGTKVTPPSGEVSWVGLASGTTYSLTVNATGFNTYTQTGISYTAGAEKIVPVTLVSSAPPPTGSLGWLTIQVWNHDGEGHPNVGKRVTVQIRVGTSWVTIKDASGNDHFHTDSAGLVSLTNLTPGSYKVSMQDASSQTSAVTAGQETYMEFQTSN
jgi:hypothetical protein